MTNTAISSSSSHSDVAKLIGMKSTLGLVLEPRMINCKAQVSGQSVAPVSGTKNQRVQVGRQLQYKKPNAKAGDSQYDFVGIAG